MESKFKKLKKYAIAGSLFLHTGNFIKRTLTRLRRKLDFVLGFCIRKLVYSRGKIQQNKIFVMTFDDSYTCNPKYIVEELLRQKLPVEIVWVIPSKGKVKKDSFPEEVKLVRRGSYTMYEEMGSAKIWLDNALNCVWYGMPKKKGQIYINTWHGSMGIKKLSGNRTWLHRARRCKKLTDFCVSNSVFEEQVYHGTFWPGVPCLKFGHARNDILFQEERWLELRKRVFDFFFPQLKTRAGVLSPEEVENPKEIRWTDKKLFLYAPTFRDSGKADFQSVDYDRLKAALEKRFGGEWVILVRTHFKDRSRKANIKFGQWLKDASQYPDMQELLAVVDMGMTDYSSWAYDYILTRRPLLLYVPDLDDYDQSRGFYYPLESTPFPLARDNDELESKIIEFDEDCYLKRVDEFLQDKGCYEDGYAAKKIAEKIKEAVGIKNKCR